AAGKTTKGKEGGSIKVIEIKKDNLGRYQVQVELDPPQGFLPGGMVGGGIGWGGPVQIQPAPLPIAPPRVAPPPPPGNGCGFQAPPAQPQVKQIQIQVAPVQVQAQPGIALAPAFFGGNGLSLRDDKGQAMQLVGQGFGVKPGGGAPMMVL